MAKMLTKQQVCEMLNISLPTLCRYMADGKIKYYKTGTSRTSKVLFMPADIKRFLSSNN